MLFGFSSLGAGGNTLLINKNNVNLTLCVFIVKPSIKLESAVKVVTALKQKTSRSYAYERLLFKN